VSVTVFVVVACLPNSKLVKLHVEIDNHVLELKFLGLVHLWYNCNAFQEAKCKSQRDPALSSLQCIADEIAKPLDAWFKLDFERQRMGVRGVCKCKRVDRHRRVL